jgi:2-aminobenzoate-CoA ligase
MTSTDVVGGVIPLPFTYGLGALLVFPLRHGAAVVLDETFNAERLLATIEAHAVTLLFGTATCYRLLLRTPEFERRFDLRSLRLCVSAGEPLEADVTAEWMRRTGTDLIDGFGTTEMFHVFLSARPGLVVPGATGTPVPGYEVRLVDERLDEVPLNTPGLLAVRGPTGCVYWRRPDAQRRYVHDGWNLTGDVMVKDDHGQYWFQRRSDDLIVSAGYNISPVEVEQVLETHPAIREAAVIGVPDPIRHHVAKAVLVLHADAANEPGLIASVHAHAQRELAGFKCPRAYEVVGMLPRTPQGPVDRAALRSNLRDDMRADPVLI